MGIDRRHLFAAIAGAGAVGAATNAQSAPTRDEHRAEVDGAMLGLRPNTTEDQTQVFQRAIEQTAAARAVLRLAPGFYRAGSLVLPSYTSIAGVAGATRIVMAGGPSMLSAAGSDYITVSGLVLDGAGIPLPERRGLLHFSRGRFVRVANCEIVGAGRNGISLESVAGEVTGNTIAAGDIAIFSIDARGLRIDANTINGAGNGGILVWRSTPGDDGTLVVDNRIENICKQIRRLRRVGQCHQHFPRR